MRGGGVAGVAGVVGVVGVDGALGRSGGRRCGLNKNADYHKERTWMRGNMRAAHIRTCSLLLRVKSLILSGKTEDG